MNTKLLDAYLMANPKANLTEYEKYTRYYGVRAKELLDCNPMPSNTKQHLANIEVINIVRKQQDAKAITAPLVEQFHETMVALYYKGNYDEIILTTSLDWHYKEDKVACRLLVKTLRRLVDNYFNPSLY